MAESPIVYNDSDVSVARVAELLSSGHVVAVPSETVYGLAANALDPDAVHQIFNIKGRPLIDPLIVHVEDTNQADRLAELPEDFEKLADHFWPGALSIIAHKRELVPGIVTAGLKTIALRSPSHPLLRRILKHSGLALAAPSANPFAYISPTTAQHVIESLGSAVKHIIDGGSCALGLESTIIDIRYPERPAILRHGPIDPREIESVLKKHITVNSAPSDDNKSQIAPGSLSSHYSPHTKLQLFTQYDNASLIPKDTAFIYMNRPEHLLTPINHSYWCSERDDLDEAASHLYDMLHRIDAMKYDLIMVEKARHSGIGITINDRLLRAATED